MSNILPFDDRRQVALPGDNQATVDFCVAHFIAIANESIKKQGYFAVALSGGSTPKVIFHNLSNQENRHQIDWKKCWIFWSDERAVEPTDPESNYHMAMEAGLKEIGIPSEQVFRMVAEKNIEENAAIYENAIKKHIPSGHFDLVMLGMGDDGHTASLFPWTDGLKNTEHLAISNYIPQKKVWRMSLTYKCINEASHIAIYVLGDNKATMVKKVLEGPYTPDDLPIQRVGTVEHPATWIIDDAAARDLQDKHKQIR
ncbi:MAG: 6-phosphogluconolactonase [Parachlamydiaceae bacterium]|nr:6-phosphogluconolactonase [Parachlamydiaceae bacterium]